MFLKITKVIVLVLGVSLSGQVKAESSLNSINLIPWPHSLESQNQRTSVEPEIYFADVPLPLLSDVFIENIDRLTNIKCKIVTSHPESGIIFEKAGDIEPAAYSLIIKDKKAVLRSGSYEGFVYGTATILQLLGSSDDLLVLPAVDIKDSPDHQYRSVMLDLARFWQPVHTIKETIDLAYLYKFSYVHLHLSDTRLFTFPSRAFPQLKSYSADGSRRHYTVEELRDIVEYARVRGIILVPEIDVPGHALCLTRQMPEVFGTVDPETGEAKSTGYAINMANEKAYEALDVLFGEVCEIFSTSPYIHIGADEVHPGYLTGLAEYMPYVKKHNLIEAQKGNTDELYAHFIIRMNDIIKKHGRQMMAWEGFHGTGTANCRIPTDIIIMAWNLGYNPPQQLLDNGYTVINSSWKPLYIVPPQNYMDSQETAYAWDPYVFQHRRVGVPLTRAADDSRIMGAQICYWEQTYEAVFPSLRRHIPVISERSWNENAGRDFDDYKQRFEQTDKVIDKIMRPVSIRVDGLLADSCQTVSFDKSLKVVLESNIPGVIRYRLDDDWGSFPDADSPEYNGSFTINESKVITAALFDKENRLISPFTQQGYFKIQPAYKYRVFGPVPKGGWPKMPDFSKLNETRNGVLGRIDHNRMHQLNRVLFSKLPKLGHIDTQPYRQFNPFALELTGQIEIPVSGEYTFKASSKFGMADVYFGDKCVVRCSKSGGMEHISAGHLQAGVYPLRIKYFYSHIENRMNIQMKRTGADKFESLDKFVLPITEWQPKSRLGSVPDQTVFADPARKKYMNLATDKPVTCSGDTQSPHYPENAVDADISNQSGWHSGSSPGWLQVDLEKNHTIDRIKLYTYYDGRRHYKYTIEVSADGVSYIEVVDRRHNTTASSDRGFEHEINPVEARYVRVSMLSNSANPGIHINELMVFEKDSKEYHVQPIDVNNFQDGQVIRYPVPLICGRLEDTAAGDVTVTNTNCRGGTVKIKADVYKGNFRALAELAAGRNRLLIESGDRQMYLTLDYQPQTNPYKLRFFYVTDNTGKTGYQSPIGDDPQNFMQKLDVVAKLIQSFTAESMYRKGHGRKTFNLEYDAEGKVVVHLINSSMPRKYFHENSAMTWYGHINQLIQDKYPSGEYYLNFAIANVTEFDPVAGKVLGGVALGSPSLALFGSGAMYTWPNSIDDVFRAFSDGTLVDPAKEFDDSSGRSARWAIASTSIGAIAHECGHGFGLPHAKDSQSIMNRGFDYFNRAFSFKEPPSRRSAEIKIFTDNESSARWTKGYAAFLSNSRFFTMDKKDYANNEKPKAHLNDTGTEIIIESANGIKWTGVFNFNKGDLYLDNKDFRVYDSPLPKLVKFSVEDVREQTGNEKFSIIVIDSLGNRRAFHPRHFKIQN